MAAPQSHERLTAVVQVGLVKALMCAEPACAYFGALVSSLFVWLGSILLNFPLGLMGFLFGLPSMFLLVAVTGGTSDEERNLKPRLWHAFVPGISAPGVAKWTAGIFMLGALSWCLDMARLAVCGAWSG